MKPKRINVKAVRTSATGPFVSTANPNITEQELDRLPSAHVSPYHTYSGSAVGGWTPGQPLTRAIAEAVTTNPTSPSANYSDQTNRNVQDVVNSNTAFNSNLLINPVEGVQPRNQTLGGLLGITGGVDTKVAADLTTGELKRIHDDAPSILGSGAIDLEKTTGTNNKSTVGDTITGSEVGPAVIKEVINEGTEDEVLVIQPLETLDEENQNAPRGALEDEIVITPAGEVTDDPRPRPEADTGPRPEADTGPRPGGSSDNSNLPAGLTMADLNSWWSGIDKSQFGGGGNSMNDFMQFMMMMNMMGGGRGMGGSQYGYGGLNPGGVSQAFDYKDMASWMQDTFGSGSGGGTTGSLNV